MKPRLKRVARLGLDFISDQYLVLFLILTTVLKLIFAYDIAIRLNWYGNNFDYGPKIDLILTLMIFMPLFVINKNKNRLAIIIASLISLVLLLDTVYFSYFSAFPSLGLLSSLGQTSDVGPAIVGLLRWWLVWYVIDIVLIIAFRKKIRQMIQAVRQKYSLKPSKPVFNFSVIFIILLLFLKFYPTDSQMQIVMDRGFDTKSTANEYGILTAHGVDIARFINEITTKLSKQQQQELKTWVTTNKPAATSDKMTGVAKGKNVIMIQVESLGGFAINQKVNGKEVTPNLDKLASSSYFYPNDHFVIGGGHTSDTDFVSNTSYFPIDDSAVFVRYGGDNFTSLPKSLESAGYSAYAYHGFNRYFWNRNQALNSLGYQKFYAEENYPKGESINMGLNDGDFLNKTADYIKSQPKPSFSYAITLSSHVPFDITPSTKALGIDPSKYPDQVGGYLEDINYTDRMLGKFFDKLKASGLYDDSLIVLYGDHIPVLPKFSAGTINYDPASVHEQEVPLMVKLPGQSVGKTTSNFGTHLDITPTILDLVGVKTNQLMFGQSLFANGGGFQNCTNQFVVFKTTGDCQDMLQTERLQSAEIIRYNQFNNL